MQRRIVIGGFVMFLLMAAAIVGAWQYRRNKPDQFYLPIPFSKEATEAQKSESVAKTKELMMTDKVLSRLAKDCGVKEYWKLSSDAEALAEVKQHAFVEVNTDKDPQTGVPFSSMRIGFHGKKKDIDMLGKMANRWGDDFKVLSRPHQDF